MKEISKAYDPKETEDIIYKKWEDSGYFNPDKLPGKRPEYFSISMPPPNATGTLHTGHAIMLAYEDLMTRYNRLLGKKTLWLPGTDHAAIATAAKVEKILYKEEHKTRHDLGREEFLIRVKDFVEKTRDTIRNQIRKMGSSCDWSRERFTLDEGLSAVVRYAFINMYEAGVIYRGNRIVNWCPHCLSTLSDDEVEYKETTGKFYTFKYSKDFPMSISTTRPE
ncbi:MAG: class I tRNA ligase family protein, partial [Candidatus Parcubacteria bacterium]|nr:class I tRNA ligase family protein [Candidatus Parcubacteria bacterium]